MAKHAPVLPITAFVGANGGGKSLAAVELMLRPAMARGLPILTNMALKYDNWVPLESWTQLTEFYGGVVLLDEINSVLPSREFRTMPAQLARLTNQLRKVRIKLGWTAPAWARADTMLREVTQGVYVCNGYWRDHGRRKPGVYRFPFSGPWDGPLDADQWPPNRLFRWKLYDAIALDEFTHGRAEQVGDKYARWYWRPAHEAHLLYDTEQDVGLLDHLDDTGVCVQCHGMKRRHACKCEPVRKPLGDYEPSDRSDWKAKARA